MYIVPVARDWALWNLPVETGLLALLAPATQNEAV